MVLQFGAARLVWLHRYMTRSTFQPLTLGTVQLGKPYGIANTSGQPDVAQAEEILIEAKRGGVLYLDTAPSYGTSEATIGELRGRVDPEGAFRVVSKVSPGLTLAQWRQQLEQTLEHVRYDSLHAWLLHDENDIARVDAEAVAMIEAAKAAGRLHSFGVSCYQMPVVRAAMQQPVVTVLQLPANVFDRRFISPEMLDALREWKGFVQVRSAFLQGLCLMAPEQAPRHVPGAFEALTALHGFCAELGMTPQAFCLLYLNHRLRELPHSLLVGVERAAQLRELLAATQTAAPAADAFDAWEERWPESPLELITTSLWQAVPR